MNLAQRQSVQGQRRMTAALAARALPALRDEPIACPEVLRRGLARIESNEGGGLYQVSELWWDPATEEWTEAVAPLGYRDAEARDYMDNAQGGAGQTVRFWEHRGLAGEIHLFIDVNGGWDGLQKVSAFTVHYSGSNTTGAFHSVPNCKQAMVEVGIDVRRCSADVPPADHPGFAQTESTGGFLGVGWCNPLATWGGGGNWRNLLYTARLANGICEGDGDNAINNFRIQCRVTGDGDLEFRVENLTGSVVSAVIMGAVRVTACPEPPGTAEIGNCCCHDDDWGKV